MMNDNELQLINSTQIMVVDDTPANLKLLTEILTSRGYKVRPASGGRLALRSIAAELPDLILLDVTMPDMDGYEVCAKLKSNEQSRGVPVIFISALVDTADKIRGFEAGGIDYITKPFQAAEVLARVETHLSLRRLQKKMEAQLKEQEEEQRQLREQVLQQQKLDSIGLLTGGIAHDFNNMLTPIIGYSGMIMKMNDPSDKVYRYAESILNAANKSKEMVRQLMCFSRKQTLAVEKHDLNEIVTSFMKMLESTIRENITIQLELCSAPCIFQGDRTQVEQVLLNLAVNAQDAISTNGTIKILTGHVMLDDEYCRRHSGVQPGSYVMLAFTDSGCGMDDAVLSRVFDPFFTTKPVGRGTGLGLSTVFGIIKQHNGYVEVKSQVGKGTTFKIFFPENSEYLPEAPPLTAEIAAKAPAAAKIVVAEDNRVILEYIQLLLEATGHTVLAADTPEEALALALEAGEIDLLVSDVVMPQMNGPELYERLLETMPGLRVLFMSGYPGSFEILRRGHEDTVGFISKPFTSEAFLKRVAAALAGR